MADVIALHRPTRTLDNTDLDLPSCGREWPGWCHGGGAGHRCWTWSGWPHICHCLRCHREAVDG